MGIYCYVSGNSEGLCINLEGWDGEGDGGSRGRAHMYTYG